MADYGTNVAEKFAAKSLQHFYARSLANDITNQGYEGTLGSSPKARRVNILSFDKIGLKDYTKNNTLTADVPSEIESTLIADQQKAYYFEIDSVAELDSYVKDPQNSIIPQTSNELRKLTDELILGLHEDVAAGNRIGVDHTDGTVEIDAAGVVTGTGSNFTADMVGKGFKADGHDEWYRVAAHNSGTEIELEKDLDDNTNTYDGGAISSGTDYVIQANEPVELTVSNVYEKIVDLGVALDDAEIPDEDRWLAVSPQVHGLLRKSEQITADVPMAYSESVQKGLVGMVAGFRLYKSPRVQGNNTDGYHIIGGHNSWATMAMAMTDTGVEDIIGGFGQAYKGLNVYGAKVTDRRRVAGAELFATVA
jgi:hypothetical protein